jgi:cytochrome c oxidase subunit 1
VAGANPWGSRGYEWLTPSPPPLENFEAVPAFERGPHQYHDEPAAAPAARAAEASHVE